MSTVVRCASDDAVDGVVKDGHDEVVAAGADDDVCVVVYAVVQHAVVGVAAIGQKRRIA